jgi:hypothetical protein
MIRERLKHGKSGRAVQQLLRRHRDQFAGVQTVHDAPLPAKPRQSVVGHAVESASRRGYRRVIARAEPVERKLVGCHSRVFVVPAIFHRA